MEKKPFLWPDQVPEEQKLYYAIKRRNRIQEASHVYETAQTFTGTVKRSQEIYFEDLYNLDLLSRGIIPPHQRWVYDLPADYDDKVKNSPSVIIPDNWQDLYLCGGRGIAIPKKRDPLLDAYKPSYGDNPLQTYLEAPTKSFPHWLAAVEYAQEHNLEIPLKPRGRIPSELQETIEQVTGPQESPVSKFEVWKQEWIDGKTTKPWRGRRPLGAEYPEGYKKSTDETPIP